MHQRKPVVLVTGSSGLIGKAVCRRFAGLQAEVIGFDREGPPYPPSTVDCIFVDMSSDESVQTGMFIVEERHGLKIDAVVHLAAYYDFSGEDNPLYEKVTVQGTKRLLHELKKFEVGQFIFSSSMLVHEPTARGTRINEDSPVLPTWPYPVSKVKTENLLKDTHGSIPVAVLRIAGVYTDVCESIPLAHQIQRIYEHGITSHFYPGDLQTAQSYVHLDDLVDAIALSVSRKPQLPNYSVFLIGEPDAMSFEELQAEIAHLLFGKDWTTLHMPKPIAKAGAWVQSSALGGGHAFIKPWMIDRADDNYVLDISRELNMLGWEPNHTLRATLPRMIEGLKVDPLRWYEVNKLTPPAWLRYQESRKSA